MKRTRTRRRDNRPNPLRAAITTLEDAVDALCAPRAHQQPGHSGLAWAPSRYTELADAIDITASRAGAGDGTSRTPCWIDPLMLKIRIDHRVHQATGVHAPIPALLRNLPRVPWRPQDIDRLTEITAELQTWVQAIDDLAAPKPVYLTGQPCPHCGQIHTYRWNDAGERIRTPALAVAADDRGAWCQSCHDRFDPFFLGRLLNPQPEQASA